MQYRKFITSLPDGVYDLLERENAMQTSTPKFSGILGCGVVASETGNWITNDLAIRILEKALHPQLGEPHREKIKNQGNQTKRECHDNVY